MTNLANIPAADWRGCYRSQWGKRITKESFRHPAKFARGLIERIIGYGLEQGFWTVGDLIGDPFAGVGCGGVVAANAGLHFVGVELEEKFVKMAAENFGLHASRWRLRWGPEFRQPVVIQGDSRNFAAIVGQAAGIITSPPWAAITGSEDPNFLTPCERRKRSPSKSNDASYGSSPGQIGRLPAGGLAGVVTSPPYGQSVHDGCGIDPSLIKGNPPGPHSQVFAEDYGKTSGNIGNLPAGELAGVVTSPPYAHDVVHARPSKMTTGIFVGRTARTGLGEYGSSSGQVGQMVNQTYWQAVADVYAQCLLALRAGGVMVVVIKDFVRRKQRVRLCDDTLRLLVHIGFEPFLRVRAHMVEERTDLLGEMTRRERKGFFRRLHESRLPPGDERRIDWEEVLFLRKPQQGVLP